MMAIPPNNHQNVRHMLLFSNMLIVINVPTSPDYLRDHDTQFQFREEDVRPDLVSYLVLAQFELASVSLNSRTVLISVG